MRATFVLIVISAASSVLAFGPAGAQGQMPGTLPPAPYVAPPPPPPVAPPPVPSVVTPLTTPRYGVPPGVTSPTTGISPSYRSVAPARHKKRYKKRRPRMSDIVIVRQV